MAKRQARQAKVRTPQVPVEIFLPRYLDALDTGMDLDSFAKSIGMDMRAVRQRVYSMRLRGHDIEYLGRPGSRRGLSNDEAIEEIMKEHRQKKERR